MTHLNNCLFLLLFRGNLTVVHLNGYILYSFFFFPVKYIMKKFKSHCVLYKGLNSPPPQCDAVRDVTLYSVIVNAMQTL